MITITHLKELEKLSSICEFVYTRSFPPEFCPIYKMTSLKLLEANNVKTRAKGNIAPIH